MTEQEKREIIKGLECCNPNEYQCGVCPYDDGYETCARCKPTLHSDAIALLKAQEPRVMKLEEVKTLGLMWLESRNGFVQPVICQNYEYGVDRSVEFIMVHGTICNSINTLGKLWRVWTSKPSDEQMEATPWN